MNTSKDLQLIHTFKELCFITHVCIADLYILQHCDTVCIADQYVLHQSSHACFTGLHKSLNGLVVKRPKFSY